MSFIATLIVRRCVCGFVLLSVCQKLLVRQFVSECYNVLCCLSKLSSWIVDTLRHEVDILLLAVQRVVYSRLAHSSV